MASATSKPNSSPNGKTSTSVYGANLSRRNFVKSGGALFVGFALVSTEFAKNPLKAAEPVLQKNTIEVAPATIEVRV